MKFKEDKEFGEYFAGEERKLPDPTERELNTPEERKVIDQIRWHIQSNFIIKPSVAWWIRQLMINNEYPDILVKPTQEYVYRGVAIDVVDGVDFEEEIQKKIKSGEKLVYTPRKPSSTSWSKSEKVAFDFAKESSDSSKIRVIFYAKVSENPNSFLDLEKWYKEINSNFKDEQEVIGFGDISVERIRII